VGAVRTGGLREGHRLEGGPRAGDIEWVAAVYRFHWAEPLAEAYAATRDDKYARAFVELTTDWIRKHPLEDWTRTHPVYTTWRGFAWLDLQTGIRATRICSAFKTLVHSEAVTPEFLGVLLASLYDHQVKTRTIPMGMVHNKAIFEQRGFMNVAATFPEFRESRSWIALGLERARENLLAQVTADGMQREWCGGYHLAVLRDAVEIMDRAEAAGLPVPDEYRRRVRAMYECIFAVATPDLGFPMFGDTARPRIDTRDRSRWPLYTVLLQAGRLLGDPKVRRIGPVGREAPARAAQRGRSRCRPLRPAVRLEPGSGLLRDALPAPRHLRSRPAGQRHLRAVGVRPLAHDRHGLLHLRP